MSKIAFKFFAVSMILLALIVVAGSFYNLFIMLMLPTSAVYVLSVITSLILVRWLGTKMVEVIRY